MGGQTDGWLDRQTVKKKRQSLRDTDRQNVSLLRYEIKALSCIRRTFVLFILFLKYENSYVPQGYLSDLKKSTI